MMIAAAPGFLGLAEQQWAGLGPAARVGLWLPLAGVALFLGGAAALAKRRRLGLFLLLAGVAWLATLAYGTLARAPSLVLLLLLATVGAALGLRASPRRHLLGRADAWAWTARGAAGTSTGLWLVVTARDAANGSALWVLGLVALTGALPALLWAARFGSSYPKRRATLLLGTLAVGASLPFLVGQWLSFFGLLAMVPAVALLALPSGSMVVDETPGWSNLLFAHAPRLLVVTFAVLCAAGTIILALPFSSASPEPISYVDALFTAVSAVCVTGLIVLDTPVDFGSGGQMVILVLIQLGALGIMTFSTAAIALLGRRMSLSHEGAVTGLIAGNEKGQVTDTVKRILLVTAACESAGALILWLLFWLQGLPPLEALAKGVFTAVSAYCNAGFALDSDSLVTQAKHPAVLHTVSTLIVLGGVSPFLVLRARLLLRGRSTRAQEKLVLVTTAVLLATGTILFLAFEWNASLAGLSFGDKLSNAWFQSVTLRTAGFNSVDTAALEPPTLVLSLLWMFIGGSPGGAAGGIKTTTAAVLILAVITTVRNYPSAQVFHRRIPHHTVYRAAAIVTGGAAAVFLAFLALLLTQRLPSGVALFEVISALGTVGLSLGGTARLDDIGKLIIAACMFAGRLGPLTLFMFLSRRMTKGPFGLPEEEIDVG